MTKKQKTAPAAPTLLLICPRCEYELGLNIVSGGDVVAMCPNCSIPMAAKAKEAAKSQKFADRIEEATHLLSELSRRVATTGERVEQESNLVQTRVADLKTSIVRLRDRVNEVFVVVQKLAEELKGEFPEDGAPAKPKVGE